MAWSWRRPRGRDRWPGLYRGPIKRVRYGTQPGRVPSPGGWTVPPGIRPAWNWTPPPGIVSRPDRAPQWARWWYCTPLIDRYAYAWMWWHGAWDVVPPAARAPGRGTAGVRDPRRPVPSSGTSAAPVAPGSETQGCSRHIGSGLIAGPSAVAELELESLRQAHGLRPAGAMSGVTSLAIAAAVWSLPIAHVDSIAFLREMPQTTQVAARGRAPVAGGLAQPHGRDRSTATSGNSPGEP